MKTDRELLELAAKAAGYWDKEFDCWNGFPQSGWAPLIDDGDALRLAVKLGLIIDPWAPHACTVRHRPEGSKRAKELATVGVGGDGVATRRAIVCAAAAIGKAK